MAGLDSFLLLTPILMLAVVALLVFVGCDAVFGLHQVGLGAQNLQANPGIPAPGTRITPVDLTWDGEGDFPIQRASSLAGPYTQIGESSSGAYTDTTVTDGTTSFYEVGGATVSITPQPPFVTGFNQLGAVQNNMQSAFYGMLIRVPSPVTVYALGRYMVAGNNGMHEIQIVDASTNNVLPGATVLLNMAGGTPDSFVYVALPAPVTMNPNANPNAELYYVVSAEQEGGDQWHGDGTMLLTTSVATVLDSIIGNGTLFDKNHPNTTFGPLDFLSL